MQQKVHLLNVNNIGQNVGEEIYSDTRLNRSGHYQCPDELLPQKECPIKLIETPPPLVHQHSKQGRETNKELLQALTSDMKP